MASAAMPELPPNQDRGPTLLGVFWAMVAVSTAMVGLRLFARYKIRTFGFDDWTILAAQVRPVDLIHPHLRTRKRSVLVTEHQTVMETDRQARFSSSLGTASSRTWWRMAVVVMCTISPAIRYLKPPCGHTYHRFQSSLSSA